MKIGPTTGGKRAAHLLLAAISELNNQKSFDGITSDGIVDHIKREYRPTKSIQHHLPDVIEKGLAFGIVEKKNGRLFMSELMEGIKSHRRRRHGGSSGGRKRRRKRH